MKDTITISRALSQEIMTYLGKRPLEEVLRIFMALRDCYVNDKQQEQVKETTEKEDGESRKD